jgi:hypothetical protein
MSYSETKGEFPGTTKIAIACDARNGKGICNSSAEITAEREFALDLLFKLGWGLQRGHQVCGQCSKKNHVVFSKEGTQ